MGVLFVPLGQQYQMLCCHENGENAVVLSLKMLFVVCQGHAADFAGSTNEEEKPKSPDQARNSASSLRRCPAQFLFSPLYSQIPQI